VPLVFPSVLSLDLKFVSLVFHAGVTCVVDLSVWVSAAYFHLGSGPHRCSSFSCSSPSPHFHEALFLVRLAERRLGSVSFSQELFTPVFSVYRCLWYLVSSAEQRTHL
jgi:hypothetical protein